MEADLSENTAGKSEPRRRGRGGRKTAAKKADTASSAAPPMSLPLDAIPEAPVQPAVAVPESSAASSGSAAETVQSPEENLVTSDAPEKTPAKPARKATTRGRRPRKTETASGNE
jgi:hypothetical protein